jgi:hypothetical protein
MLTLSTEELHELTGYAMPNKVVAELRRQGFMRARVSRLGNVILERAHYEAVCAGLVTNPAPKLQTPRLHSS